MRIIFLSLKLKGCLFSFILLDGPDRVSAAYYAMRLGGGDELQGIYDNACIHYIKLRTNLLFGVGHCLSFDHGVQAILTNFAKMPELGPALSSLHYLGNFEKATVTEWGVKIVMSMNGLSQMVPKRGLLCLKGR